MKDMHRNYLKTSLGWLVGIPILELLRSFSGLLSSTILCIFYGGFYTLVDWVLANHRQPALKNALIARKFNSGLI